MFIDTLLLFDGRAERQNISLLIEFDEFLLSGVL
jgi:hypothetical protein